MKNEHLYNKMKHHVTPMEWPLINDVINKIEKLKKEKNAVILAHNYMTPDIYHGVADFVGDSLQLAIEASKTEADVIVQCGVHFMAETSKILSPEKTVLIPDLKAGCSLAESITAKDVMKLREMYPGVPIVTYVNTSAEVKAASDICCTSSNAVKVVESLNVPKVLLIPDKYLAENVNNQTDVEVLSYDGACMVHEQFTAQDLKDYREAVDGVKIIAHPECPSEVVKEADFSGSTAAMIDWVNKNKPENVMLVTECSMASNIMEKSPESKFVGPCNLCPHMKRITLFNVLQCLEKMQFEVTVPNEQVRLSAKQAIDKMIAVK